VPDYQGRAIVGAGAGAGLTARARGDKFGAELVTLDVSTIPSHNHGGATGGAQSGGRSNGHTHPSLSNGYSIVGTASPGSLNLASMGPVAGHTPSIITNGPVASGGTSGEDADHSHAVPALGIAAQGGGAGHSNIQPSATANVFIVY
jgi:microcystin-dependent protein